MMIGRISKEQCTGCTACANVCPRDAISMRRDEEGFPYPAWEKEKCIHCGKCLAVCPAVRQKRRFALPPATYAAWAEEQLRKESSSGGAFSVFAGEILSRQGSVCGAAFTPDFQVEHRLVHETDGLGKLRRSKYVQSTLGFTFREIRRRLEAGEPVLFSGCPCQVAGLRSFLGKAYETLFTLDLICSGVTSPLAWEVYLKSQGKAIRDISFRSKARFGWTPNLEIQFADGTTLQEEISENLFCRLWLPERILVRPSCLKCPFAGLPRPGDITLADFWGIENYRPDWNDNGGTSLILVNTRKGKKLLETCISHFQRIERFPFSMASTGQEMLSHPVFQPNRLKRNKVFQELSHGKFPEKEHYDIGILNFFWCPNYGAAATGIALYHLLENLGKKPALVYPPQAEISRKYSDVPTLLSRIGADRHHTEIFFPKKTESITTINRYFDTFIAGSDQIWNTLYARSGCINTFQLLFFFQLFFAVPGKKKIAMAVSFGRAPFWNAFVLQRQQKFVQRIHAISVREKQGVEICKKLYRKRAEFVLDPVFLIEPDFYLKRIQHTATHQKEKETKEVVFLRYILEPDRNKRRIAKLSLRELKKTDSRRVSECALSEYSHGVTLDDWFAAFHSADYVVTDSFHGMCFSILFHKPFTVILNQERGADRFLSLLTLLHMEDRLVDENTPSEAVIALLHKEIHYSEAEQILAEMRKTSIAWLKHHLEEELPKDSDSYTEEEILLEECSMYLEERQHLEKICIGLQTSLSVRLGLLLTWIPRKILSILTGRTY